MALKFKDQPFSSARPDERGRITLGNSLTDGVSRYDVFVNEETGEVLLRPFKEIPAREAWPYENPIAHQRVMEGLHDLKHGRYGEVDLDKGSWVDELQMK